MPRLPMPCLPTLSPTGEQQLILNRLGTSPDSGRLIAFAGTGKTTTLRLLAEVRRGRGLYLAFNKAIQQEAARTFPRQVHCSTAHALAWRALRMGDCQARLAARLYAQEVATRLNLPATGDLTPTMVGQLVLDTVTAFCRSADPVLAAHHAGPLPQALTAVIVPAAHALWQHLSDRQSDCPITHDTYLKLWQLAGAALPAVDYLLFDEAQDANPAMVDIAVRQGVPVIWAGDPHQQIYAWRGAVNMLRRLPGEAYYLTQSFRFGPAIAAAANAILARKPAERRPARWLTGLRAPALAGRRPTVLTRTNAGWFDQAVSFRGPIHVLGGVEETCRLLLGGYALRQGERPEGVPALARFASWSAMVEQAETCADRELLFVKRLVEVYGARLPAAVDAVRACQVADERAAALVLSTTHKAKGREWPWVELAEDFCDPTEPGFAALPADDQEAEINLLYVAATRARARLTPNRALLRCLDAVG